MASAIPRMIALRHSGLTPCACLRWGALRARLGGPVQPILSLSLHRGLRVVVLQRGQSELFGMVPSCSVLGKKAAPAPGNAGWLRAQLSRCRPVLFQTAKVDGLQGLRVMLAVGFGFHWVVLVLVQTPATSSSQGTAEAVEFNPVGTHTR